MKTIISSFLLLTFTLVFSQITPLQPQQPRELNTEFATKIDYTFQHLDKSKVPHGLLKDASFEFIELTGYNGVITNKNYIHPGILKGIYKTLLTSRVQNVQTGFIQYNDFVNRWQNQRKKRTIILSGLYFKYSKFLDNAYQTGKVKIINNQIYDSFVSIGIGGPIGIEPIDGISDPNIQKRRPANVWQNPYEEKEVFAMSPSTLIHKGKQFKAKLPQNLWYSNFASQVQNIQVNTNSNIS